ncbi:MAG: YtxH domain-containing protein [Chloroflexota bacterium]|nr:YtxH domain-containing protein [Chloroflexota bacterium]
MRKILAFLDGLLTGAVVGGVLALLFTPASGLELKQQLKDYKEHLVEEGKNAATARRQEMEKELLALKKGKQ